VCSPSGLVSLLITGLDFSGFERPSFPVLAWELDSAKIFPAARFFSSVGFGFPLRGIFSPLVLSFASLLRSGSWCRLRQSLSCARSPVRVPVPDFLSLPLISAASISLLGSSA
jgi:hypothetical protein